jgi:pimeloyl-ACP methyl ester carboxylesterase
VRAFLLQNLRLGTPPAWRIGLAEIDAAMADIEGWDGPADATYSGRTMFVGGETSNYIRQDDRPTIRALFPGARFVTVKHAGHWVHADNPAGFLAVVEAFLSARGAK